MLLIKELFESFAASLMRVSCARVFPLQDSSNSGNVHTGTAMSESESLSDENNVAGMTHSSFARCVVGAVPPWLQDDPLEGTSGTVGHAHIGPSLQDFLKHSTHHPDIFHHHAH